MKHIIEGMYPEVPMAFVNTGLEYPEIQKFAIEQENVITLRPKVSFYEVIKRYGYPVVSKEVAKNVQYARSCGEESNHYKKLFGLLMYEGKKSRFCTEKWSYLYDAPFRISSRCCDIMKKAPIYKYESETGRKPYVGTLAAESIQRQSAWIRNGCNSFDGRRPISAPMSFWTEQDVLHYIKEYNVPYCSVYGDIQIKAPDDAMLGQMNFIDVFGCYDKNDVLETSGCYRTGCIFCMFGCHLEKEPNRFQRLKETHPRKYDYCINGGEMVDGMWQPNKKGLGLGFVLDYLGIKYR